MQCSATMSSSASNRFRVLELQDALTAHEKRIDELQGVHLERLSVEDLKSLIQLHQASIAPVCCQPPELTIRIHFTARNRADRRRPRVEASSAAPSYRRRLTLMKTRQLPHVAETEVNRTYGRMLATGKLPAVRWMDTGHESALAPEDKRAESWRCHPASVFTHACRLLTGVRSSIELRSFLRV
ncbi:hypothetical protein PR002_g4421 [Phytophthora rubi]|uniref:Uncharacterized protein n=1 Tax=Phytophthora rubi TaxID=129364 RepID=A0A6A3NDN0_9STRA|nr:hypothetical protein PR002_g4421 [Phytophthora rubi]